jgi:hypothetical protein
MPTTLYKHQPVDKIPDGPDLERSGSLIRDCIRRMDQALVYLTRVFDGEITGVFDHGGLSGLGDDDHIMYFRNSGRSGGQIGYGGLLATESLSFESNAAGGSTSARIQLTATPNIIFDVAAGTVDPINIALGLASGTFTGTSLTMSLVGTGGNSSSLSIANTSGSAASVLEKLVPHASQSGDMFQIRNSGDSASLASFGANGNLDVRPGGTVVALNLRRSSGGSADIQRWDNSTGSSTIVKVDGTGRLIAGANNSPTATGNLISGFGGTGTAALSTIQSNTTGWLSAQPTNGLWRLEPTLSDPGGVGSPGVGSTTCFRINTNVDDCEGAIIGLQSNVDVDTTNLGSGDASAQTLDFSATSSGSGNITALIGVSGITRHDSTGTLAQNIGGRFIVRQGTGAGTVTESVGLRSDAFYNGAVDTHYGVYVGDPTLSGGSVATAYGIYMEAVDSATTNWAIRSLGGQSSHAGNFYIGGNTAPTAKLHLAAQTTSASTAPIKMTTGSLMTTPEAGAREYEAGFFYQTNSTPTRQIEATEKNVTVDSDGNVVTDADGELVLAAA